MNGLGINAYHGDVSVVLVRDGELVAAVQEEPSDHLRDKCRMYSPGGLPLLSRHRFLQLFAL
jgi:predicted NodU family carbamoyl transferase